MSSEKNNRIAHLQEAVMQTVEQHFGSTWGRDIQNNGGFVIDLIARAGMQKSDELRILSQEVTSTGIEIRATAGEDIDSLAEITHAVSSLLGQVAEGFLVIVPKYTHETVRYWFMTGSQTHGHLGEIVMERQALPRVDLSVLDKMLSGVEETP